MKRWVREHWVGILYCLVGGFAGWLQFYGKHNNFLVFRHEYYTLMAGGDLYAFHPWAHSSEFRYSPTFALLFAPISLMSVHTGIVVWSVLNALAVYVAVRLLLPRGQANVVLLLVLIEVNNSIQNTQSNALVAALMVAAFVAYEADRPWRGAMATAAGTLIKIFPMAAGLFGLLHAPRGRWRVLLAAALVGVAGVLLPVPITGLHGLLQQYQWWHAVELRQMETTQWSLMAGLDAWFGAPRIWWPVQAAGLVALLAAIATRFDAWGDPGFRRLVLCAVLVYVTVFNYGAESPSYVIAMTGVVVWWVTGPRRSYQNVLFLLAFALSSLVHDFVPASWRAEWLNPSRARVWPVTATWVAMLIEMLWWRVSAPPVAASGRAEVRQQDVAAA